MEHNLFIMKNLLISNCAKFESIEFKQYRKQSRLTTVTFAVYLRVICDSPDASAVPALIAVLQRLYNDALQRSMIATSPRRQPGDYVSDHQLLEAAHSGTPVRHTTRRAAREMVRPLYHRMTSLGYSSPSYDTIQVMSDVLD